MNTTTSIGRIVAFSLVLIGVTRWGLAQEKINIHDGILQKKVEVTARGAGIESVVGTARRTPGTGPLVLTIPAGTVFVPDSSTVQRMVTVAPTTLDLTTTETADFSVRVACANIRLVIPSAANAFSVEPAPQQEALSMVLPVLAATKEPYPVTQAAVWIVTDNPTYGELGILVSGNILGSLGGSNSRIITESVAARAMMIIERAGGNLRQRRIWPDRYRVCKLIGTVETELTAWCRLILPAERPPVTALDADVPPDDRSYPKSSEFQVVFWIYGARNAASGSPDVTIDFWFYQRRTAGDVFFNRSQPQQLNAKTLTPKLMSAGELTGAIGVPLTSFPPGDYRLEIKVTDNLSGQGIVRNVNFAVLP